VLDEGGWEGRRRGGGEDEGALGWRTARTQEKGGREGERGGSGRGQKQEGIQRVRGSRKNKTKTKTYVQVGQVAGRQGKEEGDHGPVVPPDGVEQGSETAHVLGEEGGLEREDQVLADLWEGKREGWRDEVTIEKEKSSAWVKPYTRRKGLRERSREGGRKGGSVL